MTSISDAPVDPDPQRLLDRHAVRPRRPRAGRHDRRAGVAERRDAAVDRGRRRAARAHGAQGRGSCRSAPARSCSAYAGPARRQARGDALDVRRHDGRRASRTCASTATCSTSTRATCSPRPAPPPAIDLCLHIIRRDLGAEVGQHRRPAHGRAAAPRRRAGAVRAGAGARVLRARTRSPPRSTGRVEHLDEPLSVEAMARHATMSPRTFARRFRDVTGTTPHQWLLRQRVLHAQRLLETHRRARSRSSPRAAASRRRRSCREHFTRIAGTSPLAYRRTFRAA